MDKLIFLDIESVPSGPFLDPMTLTPPGNLKKEDTIKAWFENEAPKIALEKYKQRALDSMAGEIICIGYAISEEPARIISGGGEEEILFTFQKVVEERQGQYAMQPTFVTWNGNAFDLTWLWRKSVQYGLKDLRSVIHRDRYKGNSIDLMLTWASDYRDYRKMKDVAAFLGIEDRSGGIDGSQVYDLWKAGEIEKIKTYCMGDIWTVREIYRRIFE